MVLANPELLARPIATRARSASNSHSIEDLVCPSLGRHVLTICVCWCASLVWKRTQDTVHLYGKRTIVWREMPFSLNCSYKLNMKCNKKEGTWAVSQKSSCVVHFFRIASSNFSWQDVHIVSELTYICDVLFLIYSASVLVLVFQFINKFNLMYLF